MFLDEGLEGGMTVYAGVWLLFAESFGGPTCEAEVASGVPLVISLLKFETYIIKSKLNL